MLAINGTTILPTFDSNNEPNYNLSGCDPHFNGVNVLNYELNYESLDDLIALLFAKKHLDSLYPNILTRLDMGYIPFSRLDMPKKDQIPTLEYFGDFINWLKFTEVIVFDPITTSSFISIKNKTIIYPDFAISQLIKKYEYTHIAFKDTYTYNKYVQVIPDLLNLQNIIYTSISNNKGEIESSLLPKYDLNGVNILIIDNIYVTDNSFHKFINDLQEQSPANIDMYVSHMESTTNFDWINDSPIRTIYTTHSILDKSLSEKVIFIEDLSFDENSDNINDTHNIE